MSFTRLHISVFLGAAVVAWMGVLYLQGVEFTWPAVKVHLAPFSTVVGVLSPGDAFGETAFLLDQARTADVTAVTDDVRLLSLSEGTLRKMIQEDPVVAAKFLLNLSRMLCHRLMMVR